MTQTQSYVRPTVFREPRNSTSRRGIYVNAAEFRGAAEMAQFALLQENCVDSSVVMRTCRPGQHLYSEAAATRQPEHRAQTALPTAQTATE